METFPTPFPELRQPDAIEKARQLLGSAKLPVFRQRLVELKPVRDEPIEPGVEQTIPVYLQSEVDALINSVAAAKA